MGALGIVLAIQMIPNRGGTSTFLKHSLDFSWHGPADITATDTVEISCPEPSGTPLQSGLVGIDHCISPHCLRKFPN